jgi:hypothetical protein
LELAFFVRPSFAFASHPSDATKQVTHKVRKKTDDSQKKTEFKTHVQFKKTKLIRSMLNN